MNLKTLIAIAGILLVASCKKEDSKSTTITVNVHSTDGQTVSGVSVKLLPEKSITAVATEVSGADGKINFTIQPATTYYLYHYDSDHRFPDDATSTFIVTGTFTTQAQINNSPSQVPAAKIGDEIHLDINGDGIADKYDKVVKISPVSAGTTTAVNFVLDL